MSDKKITNGTQPGINYIDTKLIQGCEVRIEDFKVPILKANNKITKRRQSVRLQDKNVPCMKEGAMKKIKKKPKKIYLDDIKESAMIRREGENSNTANNRHIISNQYPELSDNDIVELIYQMTNFIESGVFDNTNMEWNDLMSETDLNIFAPQNSALMPLATSANVVPELVPNETIALPVSTSVTDTLQSKDLCVAELPVPLNEFVGEMPVPPMVAGLSNSVQNEYERGFAADSFGAMDLSIKKVNSMDHMKPDMIDNEQNTDSEFEELIPVKSSNIPNCKQSLGASPNSVVIQTTFEDQRSKHPCCKCCKDEAGSFTTKSNNNSIFDRQSKIIKRRNSVAIVKPRQTFIQNYNLNDCSVNRQPFTFKIPKLRKPNTDDNIPLHKYASKATQTRKPLRCLLGPESNFDMMMKDVVELLRRPCLKFLKNEDCGILCTYNHLLISSTKLAERIKDWSNESIHFLYITYIQRYNICHLKYFKVILKLFAERHLPDIILTTVKDCERFSLENNFKLILLGLIRCGLSQDDALFKMCMNSNRGVASINKILEIITSFNIINFKRTIAFLSIEIETYDFDPILGNEVIRQVCQVVPDDVLLQFCYGIIRKCHSNATLNDNYIRKLLLKM